MTAERWEDPCFHTTEQNCNKHFDKIYTLVPAIISGKSSNWQEREEKGGIDYKLNGKKTKSQK